MGRHEQPVTHLLTGDRGSGKSTVVQYISDRLGPVLSGVRSRPVHLPSGERCGIDVELLPGGTEAGRTAIPLARVTAAALAEISRERRSSGGSAPEVQQYRLAAASDPFPPDTMVTRVGPYDFSVAALAAVNDHLYRITAGADVPDGAATSATTAIVIDEIGPLELSRKDGFWPGLSSLWTDPRPLILVVRPDLVDELSDYAGAAGRQVVTVHVVTTGSISATADAIVTAMTKETSK
ncbi:MAG: hypothetical protein PF508_21720 [Spirochaeta sp.]|jgi:nucleoside-triphosphatase THEP1|nr:hypothetical protein [Spirochaeta sp.]